MTPDTVERLNAALSGRYRVERELSEGGMATVYRPTICATSAASRSRCSSTFAIKVLMNWPAELGGA